MTRPRYSLLAALALASAVGVSCSDIATRPRAEVQVSGVVSGPDGSPLQGATVEFFEPATGRPILIDAPERRGPREAAQAIGPSVVTTDAQGRYSTTLPGATYEVWISAAADSGFLPLHLGDVTLRPPRVDLPLRYAGYRVSGVILVPGGALLGAGEVLVSTDNAGTRSGVVNGRYTFLLPRGVYRFSVRPQVVGTGIPVVDFTGVGVSADTTIDFSLDGNRIEGTVTGPGGTPMDGAYVNASGFNVNAACQTAADGTYQLYLPSREYRFYVDPGRTYIATRTLGPTLVTAPMTLDIDVSGAEWTGTVRNAATNQGVPQIQMRAFGQTFSGGSFAAAVTAPDGSFRLVMERGTRYDLAVTPLDPNAPFVLFPSVLAGNDSTFDILLQPPTPSGRPSPRRGARRAGSPS
jgi:hypothetical protein